jgi:hypothetical protein
MDICKRYKVQFDENDYKPAFDLPDGYVAGWVGGPEHGMVRFVNEEVDVWERTPRTTIYVGVDPDGRISS